MPLPSRDELRERLAAGFESLEARTMSAISTLQRAFEARPALGRALGIAASVLVFTAVAVCLVTGQNTSEGQPSSRQLVVPAITSNPRASEQNAAPTVGAPPHPGAPPEPGAPPASASGKAPTSTASGRPSVTESPRVAVGPGGSATPGAAATPDGPTASGSRVGAPSAPSSTGQAAEHEVTSGETLARVALRYGVPFEQIASDSGIRNPNRIRPGRRLLIRAKPADVEVIQPGRTLSDYARSSGRRLDELMRRNPQVADSDRILAGGRLNV
jgi:LysM repeat protein